MFHTPRTIAFQCELLHPPVVPEPGPAQRIHNRFFAEGRTPLYRSFVVTPEGAVLSNPTSQPGAVSSVALLKDRLQFREELTGITVDEFAERLHEVVTASLEERPVPLFTAQVVTVRTLVNPRSYRDSRDFLRKGLFGFGDELEAFGRDPNLFGMRLVFPPTPEEQHAFALRIESFASEPRSLFLENLGTFGPVMHQQDLGPLRSNVQATYDFLVERTLPFLGRFDERQPT